MTIQQFRALSVERLAAVADDAVFETEQILRTKLGMSAHDVLLARREELTEDKLTILEDAVGRRLAHEPLQYICGEWDFFGLRMFCGEGCLIPRPETEMLSELAIRHLPRGGRLLDLCTGSGCITVSVLNNRHDVTATAIDISPEALAYARKNADYHGVTDRVNFIEGDIIDYRGVEIPDVIVSNPPYIKTDDIPSLSEEVRHEPYIALNGGHDGLDMYKVIAAKYHKCVPEKGHIFLEVGYDIGEEVAAIFRAKHFNVELLTDPFGIERVCHAFWG